MKIVLFVTGFSFLFPFILIICCLDIRALSENHTKKGQFCGMTDLSLKSCGKTEKSAGIEASTAKVDMN